MFKGQSTQNTILTNPYPNGVISVTPFICSPQLRKLTRTYTWCYKDTIGVSIHQTLTWILVGMALSVQTAVETAVETTTMCQYGRSLLSMRHSQGPYIEASHSHCKSPFVTSLLGHRNSGLSQEDRQEKTQKTFRTNPWLTICTQETFGGGSDVCALLLLLLSTQKTPATEYFLCACSTPRARAKSFLAHLHIFSGQSSQGLSSGRITQALLNVPQYFLRFCTFNKICRVERTEILRYSDAPNV